MHYSLEDIPLKEIAMIKPLWQELNRVHLDDSPFFKQHFRNNTFEKRIESFLGKADNDIKITVVRCKNSVQGYCISTIESGVGEIDSLYLDESLRGKNIGAELVDSHVAWLKENRCRKIQVSVSYGHEGSVLGFYEKMGFKPRLVYLEYKDEN